MKKNNKVKNMLTDYNKKYDDSVIYDPEENLYNDPLQNENLTFGKNKYKSKNVKKAKNSEIK